MVVRSWHLPRQFQQSSTKCVYGNLFGEYKHNMAGIGKETYTGLEIKATYCVWCNHVEFIEKDIDLKYELELLEQLTIRLKSVVAFLRRRSVQSIEELQIKEQK